MKKLLLLALALAALTGLLHCVLIEPAFAYQDEAAHSDAAEESESCFVHCSSCHLWAASARSTVIHDVRFLEAFIPESASFHPDSPAGSIFHPPLAR